VSKLSEMLIFCRIESIYCVADMDLYGCTHGRPIGVSHLTGSLVLATILAHFANQVLILLASEKRSPMH
jgi:hypothetical protein